MKGITKHQFEAVFTLRQIEQATGQLPDLDQLLSKLSWNPSKESIQFTVRALVGKGFIEKFGIQTRRGRNRVCFRVTEPGKLVLDPRGPVPGSALEAVEVFVPGVLSEEILDNPIVFLKKIESERLKSLV